MGAIKLLDFCKSKPVKESYQTEMYKIFNEYCFKQIKWEPCFEVLLPKLATLSEQQQKNLISAFYELSVSNCQEYVRILLNSDNPSFILVSLKQFLKLNYEDNIHEADKGLACIFESIVNKTQAIATIQAILSLPPQLQKTHLHELKNQVLLIQNPDLDKTWPRLFSDYSKEKVYQEWETAFEECELIFGDRNQLEENYLNQECRDYNKNFS